MLGISASERNLVNSQRISMVRWVLAETWEGETKLLIGNTEEGLLFFSPTCEKDTRMLNVHSPRIMFLHCCLPGGDKIWILCFVFFPKLSTQTGSILPPFCALRRRKIETTPEQNLNSSINFNELPKTTTAICIKICLNFPERRKWAKKNHADNETNSPPKLISLQIIPIRTRHT